MSLHKSQNSTTRNPPIPCWQCSDWYFVRFYPLKKHVFQYCHKQRHKENFCPAGQTPIQRAASILAVKKATGKVRICADFSTGINAIQDTHQYPLPVPEDLFAKLNGRACFVKRDLSYAYLQTDAFDEYRDPLTIKPNRSLFQFTRFPFGVNNAPAILQEIMDTMLMGTEGAAAYLEDILVTGSNPDKVLRTRPQPNSGLRLPPASGQVQFFVPSVK
ncbi:unnamed protein product [Schistocephalus solidus]|uniref:Reverse transcriptase domain-containing protein n=1 Tax=Schistocephalus solidus TaxID=70667 RepID=A0A183TCY8_SCHSO|nr:unnamed protein product [Schistocephalus solidus]